MSHSSKITAAHLERQAVVYIRQSSLRQVEENLESQDLQYQLAQRARSLGWAEERIRVIDDDLGKSGISAANRAGFQSLAAVGLGQVGLILVTDVSRLARNCADWYRLLDLASVYGTLISDSSGISDPRIYDDRLLLRLKGTFSEAQWHSLRTQLGTAKFNKAKRGELHLRLPVGLVRVAEDRVALHPDAQVQSAIRHVFTESERLGSAHKVLRALRDQSFQLPRREGSSRDEAIRWERPAFPAIYAILKNPAYAGAYAYGKMHRTHLPGCRQGRERLLWLPAQYILPVDDRESDKLAFSCIRPSYFVNRERADWQTVIDENKPAMDYIRIYLSNFQYEIEHKSHLNLLVFREYYLRWTS